MSQVPRCGLRIVSDDGFVSTAVARATLHDDFSNQLYPIDLELDPPRQQFSDYLKHFTRGEEVEVIIDVPPAAGTSFPASQASQGRFIIWDVKEHYGTKGMRLALHLENLLSVPHQAEIHPDYNLGSQKGGDQSIEGMLKTVLAPYFPNGVNVITDPVARVNAMSGKPLPGAAPPLFSLKDASFKQAAAKANESVLKFINTIVTRTGCIVRTDGKGNIVVAPPNYTQADSASFGFEVGTSVLGPQVDRFMEDTLVVHSTNKGMYSELNTLGQPSQGAIVGQEATAANVSRPKAPIKAADILPALSVYTSTKHPFCPMYVKDKQCPDKAHLRNSAMLVMGSHAIHAFQVTGDVDGWISSLTGRIHTVDSMNHVYVEGRVNESMWLLSRVLHWEGKGQRTSCTLIPSGALVLGPKPGT